MVVLKAWMDGSSTDDNSDAEYINPLKFRWKREFRFMIGDTPPVNSPSGVFDIKIVRWKGCDGPHPLPLPGKKPSPNLCGEQEQLKSIINTAGVESLMLDLSNQSYSATGSPAVFTLNLDNTVSATTPNQNLILDQNYLFQVREKENGKVVASSPVIPFRYRYQP
jgi:hypothetical protein